MKFPSLKNRPVHSCFLQFLTFKKAIVNDLTESVNLELF